MSLGHEPRVVDLDYPFRGEWLVRHSPADRVPSYGTAEFGWSYAIDFVPVLQGRSAALTLGSVFRPEAAAAFPGFGRALLSPVDGVVVAAHGDAADHAAYRGFASIGYA